MRKRTRREGDRAREQSRDLKSVVTVAGDPVLVYDRPRAGAEQRGPTDDPGAGAGRTETKGALAEAAIARLAEGDEDEDEDGDPVVPSDRASTAPVTKRSR